MQDFKYNEIMKAINRGEKPLVMFPIERSEVEGMEFKRVDGFFKTITKVGKHLKGSCGITISGYDESTDELWEIEAVCKFVAKMFKRYPYLLYYMAQELEADKWMLSAWADKTHSSRSYDTIMNAIQAAELGVNAPRFPVLTSFDGKKFEDMLKGLRAHGVKIGDKEGAMELELYYRTIFTTEERI